jgi:hypothetical protein
VVLVLPAPPPSALINKFAPAVIVVFEPLPPLEGFVAGAPAPPPPTTTVYTTPGATNKLLLRNTPPAPPPDPASPPPPPPPATARNLTEDKGSFGKATSAFKNLFAVSDGILYSTHWAAPLIGTRLYILSSTGLYHSSPSVLSGG